MEKQWLQSHENRWVNMENGNVIEYDMSGIFVVLFADGSSEAFEKEYTGNVIRYLRLNVFGVLRLPEGIKE